MKLLSKLLIAGAATLATATAVVVPVTVTAAKRKAAQETQQDESHDETPAQTDVAVTGVSLNKKETSIYFGSKERLTATVAPENATNKLLTWTSSNEDVAVVNATGLVAAVGTGDAVIKVASQADATKYDECTVHVSVEDKTVHVTSVEIAEESFELDLGGKTNEKAHVTVLPEDATNKSVVWTSSDPSKVLVDSSTGDIVAVAKTTTPVIITAKSVDDPTKSDTVLVTVADTTDYDVHVSSISLPEALNLDLKDGGNGLLTAEITPSNAGDREIEWSLSEEGVVSVSKFGSNSASIHALKTGTVTITATSHDNSEATASCVITVEDSTVYATGVSIKVNSAEATEASVELNKNITIDASVLPAEADNKEIIWEVSSADEEFVTLSSKESAQIIVIGKKVTSSPVTLTAKAKADPTKSKSISVSVIDPTDVDQFVSFNDPVDYSHYKTRIEADNLNEVEGLSENADLAKGNYFKYAAGDAGKALYKVGDQGSFKFAVSGNVLLKGDSEPTVINNIETTKKLYIDNAGTYEVVDTISNYMSVADSGVDYTFTAAAAGHKFKLELQPSSKYYTKTAKLYEFEFEVVHGYNVDSLAELSLFDNSQAAWNDYKIASGLGGVTAQGGIVLHKDIEIVSSILPSMFVESEADLAKFKVDEKDDEYAYWKTLFSSEAEADAQFVGSLKDCKAILNRDTKTEDFSFEGNFFSVDCSSLKTIADLSGGFGGDGSHTSLFNINNLDMIDGAVGPSSASQLHDITMRNFTVKANGGLVTLPDDSLSEFEKGGLIAFKMDSARVHVENAIVTQAFTAFMMFDDQDHHLTEFEADRVIGYDSYNSVFYVHGTDANTLSNAWVNKAGGPLVLLDENNSEGSKTYSEANMDCTNCYMHNLVTGTEPWFAGHTGATAMVQGYITTPGSAPTDPSDPANVMAHWYYGAAYQFAQTMSVPATTIAKIMEDGTYCDFVAIDVNARHFADNTTQNLTGHFTLNNGAPGKNVNMQMSTVAKTVQGEYSAPCAFPNWTSPSQAYLVSSANGGNMLLDMSSNSASINDYGHFTSDYVNVFLNPAAQGGTLGAIHGRYISIVLGTFSL